MSFLKCSYCGLRAIGGIAHVYWFIPSRTADVFRVRQRLCLDDLAANVEAFVTPQDVDILTCAACGIDVETDVFPIYVTYFLKREGAVRLAMALCEPHQLEIKNRAAVGAEELPDRYLDSNDAQLVKPEAPTDRISTVGPPTLIQRTATAHEVFSAMGRLDPGVKGGR